ncbi:hypothetical protein T12_4092 [Trichinella patagoniensis]|uniref:Uncharacterized protein n=1 Tax=Trichinella patagoniensis TaxID=990121 RepID=A0A0V0ZYD4_9BILA|nr:hypothetical protein T12_4092 [Trichinella patagoniensis]
MTVAATLLKRGTSPPGRVARYKDMCMERFNSDNQGFLYGCSRDLRNSDKQEQPQMIVLRRASIILIPTNNLFF